MIPYALPPITLRSSARSRRSNVTSKLACFLATLLLARGLCAQNLLPSMSVGDAVNSNDWRFVGGKGQWVGASQQGRGALMVEGNGNDESRWETKRMNLRSGALLALRFSARRDTASSSGSVIAGPSRINRDFFLTDSSQHYEFVFCVPSDATNDFLRLGQWHVDGKVFFDDAELLPVAPVHRRLPGGLELGEGESIRAGRYRFDADFSWVGANYHRPLVRSRAAFNSNRWILYPGAEVVYRFSVSGGTQTNGIVRAAISDSSAGVLRIEASRDGKSWLRVASLDGGRRSGTNAIPDAVFPAKDILIRFSLEGPSGRLQINALNYEAALAEQFADEKGETRFMEILQHDDALAVKLDQIRPTEAAGGFWFDLTLTNRALRNLELRGAVAPETLPPEFGPTISLARGQSGQITLRGAVTMPGHQLLRLLIEESSGRPAFVGQTEFRLGWLDDPRPGYVLTGAKDLNVWWCESGWKIGRERAPPLHLTTNATHPLLINAASGEYEAAQLILRPERDGTLLGANPAPLKNDHGEVAPISITLNEQAYVRVTQVSDDMGAPGWHPDPLPPLMLPLALRSGLNLPLWVTFHVADHTKPGDYQADLSLETSFGTVKVPLRVHVYGFSLPVETHLRSAVGLEAGAINRYHRLTDRKAREEMYEQYLLNYAEHRISPYSAYNYAPINVRFEGEGTNQHARVDFDLFDPAAEKWFNQYHFSTLKVPILGMGSVNSQQRSPGELAGFKQGSPEYARLLHEYLGQIEAHLRERGWLDKTYLFWIDEPTSKNYDFVVSGMEHLKAAAPGMKRLLTVTPDPKLIGHVDIWCGLTHKWNPAQIAERRSAGEQVWWYICTIPKAPYVTEFIDHPAMEMRLWPWQSWQYGVSGILIWNTVYWHSAAAFPDPKLQDPWTDPMSYVSGAGLKPPSVGAWGNGDGRFIYPSCHPPEAVRDPCLAAPVNSLRWENLRDGMEDYEYFWLLQKEIDRAMARGGDSSLLSEARRLLVVPPEVSKDLTHFTTDPRPLLAHRDRLAQMIEKLQSAAARSR